MLIQRFQRLAARDRESDDEREGREEGSGNVITNSEAVVTSTRWQVPVIEVSNGPPVFPLLAIIHDLTFHYSRWNAGTIDMQVNSSLVQSRYVNIYITFQVVPLLIFTWKEHLKINFEKTLISFTTIVNCSRFLLIALLQRSKITPDTLHRLLSTAHFSTCAFDLRSTRQPARTMDINESIPISIISFYFIFFSTKSTLQRIHEPAHIRRCASDVFQLARLTNRYITTYKWMKFSREIRVRLKAIISPNSVRQLFYLHSFSIYRQ